ncbi:MAG: glutamyl-tRNA reductase [Sulfurimonas sp.]
MHYLNISFTHKNSTLNVREKLSYSDDKEKHSCLKALLENEHITGAILISTCNRIEVLANCNDVKNASDYIFNLFSKRSGLNAEVLKEHADIFDDSTAIHHLFSVAASLDSMVLGETQIVGQLKDAFRFAYDNHYCGKKLARAMKNAFVCAARVRNTTEISSKPVSIASVSVSKLKSLVSDLHGKKALVIGVGEMSEITAKHLVTAGADVYIANRTQHKADALAKECSTKTLPFAQLRHVINEFEILFTATSSHEPIITDDMIKPCSFERYWFDLALPRDISCSSDDKINLFVIDDLKTTVDENLEFREEAARAAHGIIGRGVVDFFDWLSAQDIEPTIKEIYLKADEAAQEESSRAVHCGYIPKEYEDEAKKMCEQALKRFLHDITKNIRNGSDDFKSELLSGAMNSQIKKKRVTTNEKK